MSYSEKFLKVIDPHMRVEGWDKIVEDPLDPGGLTKFGISKRFNPDVDVRNLDPDGARGVFNELYWKPMRLEEFDDDGVIEEMFDAGAGPNGIHVAISILQGSLIVLGKDISLDGAIGPQTIGAANSYRYPKDLVKVMNGFQFVAFAVGAAGKDEIVGLVKPRLPMLRRFIRGWTRNRVKI